MFRGMPFDVASTTGSEVGYLWRRARRRNLGSTGKYGRPFREARRSSGIGDAGSWRKKWSFSRRRSSIDFAKSSRAEAIPPTTASEGDKPAADGRRSGLRRGPGPGAKGDEGLLRPLQGLPFLVPEMGRGDLRLEQLDDPRGGLDLLGLDRSLHEVRGEPGLELRQARVVGGEGEELLHEPEGLVEAALHDLVLDRPPEHGEAVGEPRLHHGTAEGRTAISICRRQYVGMSGSMNSAQASIPPTRFFTLRNPSSRRKFVILADRIPDLQYTTMSSAVLSSFTRAATWATGMRTASSSRAISHSMGSRTSSRTTCPSFSIVSFSACTVIWYSSETRSPGPRRPQNSS